MVDFANKRMISQYYKHNHFPFDVLCFGTQYSFLVLPRGVGINTTFELNDLN
jgi:hypothetical protein